MPIARYFKGHGEEVMRQMVATHGEKVGEREFYATANKLGLKPREHLSKGQRAMRDRSTKGSPPFTHPEFAQGFRRIAG